MTLSRNDYLTRDLDRATSLNFLLERLHPWLEDSEVTEICVNRPKEVFCERLGTWERSEVDQMDFKHLKSLATAAASFTKNEISDSKPILSAILPGGERI